MLINKANVIDAINIKDQDIIKSINYIKQEKVKSLIISNDLAYKTFTQREIEDFFNEITNKIISLIKDVILEK